MNKLFSFKNIFLLAIIVLGIYIFLNFDYLSFKYSKINQTNYYTIMSSISDSKLSTNDKHYLKLSMFNHSLKPEDVYGKSVNQLIKEGKLLSVELNNSITNSLNEFQNSISNLNFN